MENKKSQYIEVVNKYTLPHYKQKSITVGSFPSKFIKLEFTKGTPIAIKGIQVYGCAFSEVDRTMQMGIDATQLLVQNANSLIY